MEHLDAKEDLDLTIEYHNLDGFQSPHGSDTTVDLYEADGKVISLLDSDDEDWEVLKQSKKKENSGIKVPKPALPAPSDSKRVSQKKGTLDEDVVDLTSDTIPTFPTLKSAVDPIQQALSKSKWKDIFSSYDDSKTESNTAVPAARSSSSSSSSSKKRSISLELSLKAKSLRKGSALEGGGEEAEVELEEEIEEYSSDDDDDDDGIEEEDIDAQKSMNIYTDIPILKEQDFIRKKATKEEEGKGSGSSSSISTIPTILIKYPQDWMFYYELRNKDESSSSVKSTGKGGKGVKKKVTPEVDISNHRLIKLSKKSESFQEIKKLFHDTSGGQPFEIISIYRNENRNLWNWYCMKREEIAQKNKTFKVGSTTVQTLTNHGYVKVTTEITQHPKLHTRANEQYLFHGSKVGAYRSIISTGFDIRVANMGGSLGAGIYFAPNSSYSLGYLNQQTQGQISHMLVNRVTLGKVTRGNAGLRRPPNIGHTNELFDSVTDAMTDPTTHLAVGTPNMFVVYDNYQAYPEYIIALRRAAAPQQAGGVYNYNIPPVVPYVNPFPPVRKKRVYRRKMY